MSEISDSFTWEGLSCFEDVIISRDVDAVYSSSGHLLDHFFLKRKDELIVQNSPPQSIDISKIVASFKDDSTLEYSVWLKWLNFDHFGHLLTETVSSVWPLLLDQHLSKSFQILCLVPSRQASRGLAQLQRMFPERDLQIRSVADLSHSWMACKTLMLPHQSMINKSYVAPEHCQFVKLFLERYMRFHLRLDLNVTLDSLPVSLADHIRSKENTDYQYVYLSRSRLAAEKRLFVEEEKIENELILRGWTVIHLEKIPLNVQLEVLKKARVVVGSRGSAFHLLMALSKQELESKKIIFLDKRRNKPSKDSFHLQFKAQELDATIIPCLFRYNAEGLPRIRLVNTIKWEDIVDTVDQFKD